MDTRDAQTLVVEAIGRFTPGLDPRSLDAEADLRDELALDSIDFLMLVESMGRHVGRLIPEYDHLELTTVGGCVGYLTDQAPAFAG